MQQILEFAHVAREWMAGNGAERAFGEPGRRITRLLRNPGQQCRAQRWQVFPALPQRGDDDLDDVQAVIEILAEPARLYVGGQVAVGGADDAHIHGLLLGRAQGAHAALLDGAQQLRLHRQGQVANFIEKQRAAARCLEITVAILVGARVRAFAGTEKLGF